jgi:metallo-beta-lactamase family protein
MVLIPAFAVGRTQQIVYALHKLFNKRAIPAVPIYVDSPLATRVTDIFRLHPETYDVDIRKFLLQDDDNNPFGFDSLQYTQSVDESKKLNSLREPAIVISASGMMEGGRILHHLRNRISDSRNSILITGWQAPNTLGRRIVERQPVVRIYGEEYSLKAHVEVLTGFSGHADREGLLNFVRGMRKKPRQTFLVHGEGESLTELSKRLKADIGLERLDIPEMHQTFAV